MSLPSLIITIVVVCLRMDNTYLQQRGLSAEISKRFQIGFVPNAMDTVLRKFGVNREEQPCESSLS